MTIIKYRPIKNYENYIVYETGKFYNTENKNYLSDKNRMICFYKDYTKNYFSKTHVIYETWYDVKLTSKDRIGFKDKNRNNFHYTNLYITNLKPVVIDLDQIIVKRVKVYDNYWISENGVVHNKMDKPLKVIYHPPFKSAVVNLYKAGKMKTFTLTRLIYETFYDVVLTKKDIIKFQDNNAHNFHYTNLINVNAANKHLNHIELDTEKEWKIIEKYPDYKLSDYGDVFSIRSNRLLNPYKNLEGYLKIGLSNGTDQCKYFFIHRLVYFTFNKSIPDYHVVDHINRKRDSNHIDNLREATMSENAKNCEKYDPACRIIHQYSLDGIFIKEWKSLKEIEQTLKKQTINIILCCLGKRNKAFDCKWKYASEITDLTDFNPIITNDNDTYSLYKMNTKGVVINKNNLLLINNVIGGYEQIKLKSDKTGKFKWFRIHRLVAMTYVKNDNPKFTKVNHIDKNKLNNDVANLEWCDESYNTTHSCGVKVNQINIKTNKIVNTFPSIAAANKSLKRSDKSTLIGMVCKGTRTTAYGYKWSYAT